MFPSYSKIKQFPTRSYKVIMQGCLTLVSRFFRIYNPIMDGSFFWMSLGGVKFYPIPKMSCIPKKKRKKERERERKTKKDKERKRKKPHYYKYKNWKHPESNALAPCLFLKREAVVSTGYIPQENIALVFKAQIIGIINREIKYRVHYLKSQIIKLHVQDTSGNH